LKGKGRILYLIASFGLSAEELQYRITKEEKKEEKKEKYNLKTGNWATMK
jgi:hypothetical protein